MAKYLRQNTASQEIKLGPFVSDSDGVTPNTGLTPANTDIKLTKGGSATEASKNSGGATHVAAGRYTATLDATDTNTSGNLEVDVVMSGCLPVHRDYEVLPEDVYDFMHGTGTYIEDLVWDALMSGHVGDGTFGKPVVLSYAKNVAVTKFSFAMFLKAAPGGLATGKTITAEISKNGGSFTAVTDSVTEIGSSGCYEVDLAQAEMNADEILLKLTETDCRDHVVKIRTQP